MSELELNNSYRSADTEVPPASGYPDDAGPSTGITYPEYYKPTESIINNNFFFPGSEPLPENEMRITFVGSSPFPPRLKQAGTAIMVELGQGVNEQGIAKIPLRYFFDFGPGCMRNIIGLQIPAAEVNKFFITHLHGDHFSELGYIYCFGPYFGRYWPMEVIGPSGQDKEIPWDPANPDEFGTRHMVEGMKQMYHWHSDAFSLMPVGEGYEVIVTEFDWTDEGGICYQYGTVGDPNSVTIKHWPRSHAKNGASAYKLEWVTQAGDVLSFVWTGDGRPDESVLTYASGVDVFVTECQFDTGILIEEKYGLPVDVYNFTIDTHHTPHYAVGHLMQECQPRLGMITHMEWEHTMIEELVAGIRVHYPGLFVFGAPDNVVVNVTKDNIWARGATIPELAGITPPTPATFEGQGEPPTDVKTREEMQHESLREMELDPAVYTPKDVERELITEFPFREEPTPSS